MLVYIEFISRRPNIGLHEFHKVVNLGQAGWAGDYGDDVTVLSVGRSWRLGPEPEYMHIWYTPNQGLDRIDFWEETFRSGDADAYEEPFRLAARIDRAGCYDPILEPQPGTSGRYYGEHFELAPGATLDDARRQFEERRARHPELPLVLAVHRIGKLAPDPGGLAMWGLPSWGAAEQIARDLDGDDGPVRLLQASFWADFGDEQL